jgi:hypothetical protein
MAYTIGIRTYTGTGKLLEGIYLWKSKYEAKVADLELLDTVTGSIYYIEELEAAKKYVQFLARHYRNEFRTLSKKLNIPMSEFRIYLLKCPEHLKLEPETKIRLYNKKGKFWGDISRIKLMKIVN